MNFETSALYLGMHPSADVREAFRVVGWQMVKEAKELEEELIRIAYEADSRILTLTLEVATQKSRAARLEADLAVAVERLSEANAKLERYEV